MSFARRIPAEHLNGILPPFVEMQNNYLVAPNYHLATCQIERNMDTTLDSLFCYLSNTTNFSKSDKNIGTTSLRERQVLKIVVKRRRGPCPIQ
ncbi:hypothetical protein Q1695_012608 [Nippostrongylus brasiliensis]|nr:hypothetical protein Q1695_012608 [Nippostrongylus brasiliensis]